MIRPRPIICSVALLELRESGLYCAAGDFYIDPWGPADRAIVTHAHPGHAHPGCRAYLTARAGETLLRARVGADAAIQGAGYGETIAMGSVTVSLHPSGHILGCAQVRLEHAGEVWVFSGDYSLAPDPTCAPFEPVRCHTFVTESTFALPIFRWPAAARVFEDIHAWWRANQDAGKASLLFAHPLGAAQRVLATLDRSIGPVYTHDAVEGFNRIYREQGIPLASASPGDDLARALVVAPPAARGTTWARRFGGASTALVSGWMRIRGTRRRRSLDRGFVLSGHADWPALLSVIDETRAEAVWVTDGHRAPLVRWLQEHGRRAVALDARFEEEDS